VSAAVLDPDRRHGPSRPRRHRHRRAVGRRAGVLARGETGSDGHASRHLRRVHARGGAGGGATVWRCRRRSCGANHQGTPAGRLRPSPCCQRSIVDSGSLLRPERAISRFLAFAITPPALLRRNRFVASATGAVRLAGLFVVEIADSARHSAPTLPLAMDPTRDIELLAGGPVIISFGRTGAADAIAACSRCDALSRELAQLGSLVGQLADVAAEQQHALRASAALLRPTLTRVDVASFHVAPHALEVRVHAGQPPPSLNSRPANSAGCVPTTQRRRNTGERRRVRDGGVGRDAPAGGAGAR
jgi:hypothetical protein